jgi:phosphocarrier protein
MSHDATVARRQVEVTNPLGLHLRPAEKFVKLALQFQAEIRVYYNGSEHNGRSILELASLAAECGTRLDVEARGPDAVAAVAALGDLVEAQFYEDENGEPTGDLPGAEPPPTSSEIATSPASASHGAGLRPAEDDARRSSLP